MKPGVADIAFLDPPFNLGKDYGPAGELETTDELEYEEYFHKLLQEVVRVLAEGGALFLYHLPYWASRFCYMLQSELIFRHWIAISMKASFARGEYLYPAHYALLYFTKGKPKKFSRPKISPRRCHNCLQTIKDYGGYTGIIEEKGLNLSDVWDDLSPVRHKSIRLRKANQLPMGITARVTEIAGFQGGVLVDPFMGTGTALISAFKAGMQFVGNDLDPASLPIVRKRLAAEVHEHELRNLRDALG